MGRFINADNYPSTGQGLTGNNMFAYCGNNPVTMTDHSGTAGTLAIVCAVSTVISGVSNALSTASTGGSLEECLLAGLCGAVGGAVGAFVGYVVPIDPLRQNVLGRGIATAITDIATSYVLNGKVTTGDIAWTAVDVTMDVTLSPITYFYNPIQEIAEQTAVNAAIDGGTDIAQTILFTNTQNSSNSNTRNKSAVRNRPNRDYAQRKVGLLLGIS